MSRHQYYEFQAIERPLGEADREALRTLSSRAQITAASFTNHYEWGDFRGDPRELMERWFDLHLHLAGWGTRRLMIRLPKRLVDRSRIASFLGDLQLAKVIEAGEYLILDIRSDDRDAESGRREDGSGWLGVLAPFRADLLSGDWRLLYLVWLKAAAGGALGRDEPEPLPGIGPLTGRLEAFAAFFRIDPDFVQAAAEAPAGVADGELSPEAVRAAVASIPESEKTELLCRLAEGDPYVAAETRNRVREAAAPASGKMQAGLRTVSQLRRRAAAIRRKREAAEAARREAERLQRERELEDARRARLDALRRRGESVWRDVESEIERRNSESYDRAAALLSDLKVLAEENGTMADFRDRLNALRLRHERKKQFVLRLRGM